MKSDYPLVHFMNECFQEYKDEVSLVLWSYNCNLKCSWCSMKDLIYDKKNILDVNYIDLIKSHTSLETAVVFLGGEPTLYPRGLITGCSFAKELGLKTKIFTNGFNKNIIHKLLNYNLLDSISIDYKDKYPNNIIYLLELVGNRIPVEIRTTIHPELREFDLETMEIVINDLKKYYQITYYKQRYQQF